MAKLIVIYSLKPGVTADDFEAWAGSIDIPGMDRLRKIEAFTTLRHGGEAGDSQAPLDYVEVYHVIDTDSFDVSDMPHHFQHSMTGQFMGFAAAPKLMISAEQH